MPAEVPHTSPAADDVGLIITRTIRAPRALVWKAWTDPVHLREWWCPKPWTTEVRAFDLRPGGAFHTILRGPDGGMSDNPGAFLEIVEGERLVWTLALVDEWRPADAPWMPLTAYITLADAPDGGTHYTARVLHPNAAVRRQHEEMGFFDGWNTCITQLEAYAAGLSA